MVTVETVTPGSPAALADVRKVLTVTSIVLLVSGIRCVIIFMNTARHYCNGSGFTMDVSYYLLYREKTCRFCFHFRRMTWWQ